MCSGFWQISTVRRDVSESGSGTLTLTKRQQRGLLFYYTHTHSPRQTLCVCWLCVRNCGFLSLRPSRMEGFKRSAARELMKICNEGNKVRNLKAVRERRQIVKEVYLKTMFWGIEESCAYLSCSDLFWFIWGVVCVCNVQVSEMAQFSGFLPWVCLYIPDVGEGERQWREVKLLLHWNMFLCLFVFFLSMCVCLRGLTLVKKLQVRLLCFHLHT